jgi:parvulin-like peptidyl-prolyl isomerase
MKVLVILAFCLVALLAYFFQAPVVENEILVLDKTLVASISERTISVVDLVERIKLRSGGIRQQMASEQQKQLVLNEMIAREVQVIAAMRAGYNTDPKIIAAFENLMVAKLRNNQLDQLLNEVNVTDNEIAAYYQDNIARYTTPAMTRFAMIQLALSPQASPEKYASVKTTAEEVYSLAKTLPDSINGFGSLAAKYSEHQASRYSGGDVGWLTSGNQGQFDAVIATALTQLTPEAKLSPLVRAIDGFYLLKLIDIKPEHQKLLAQVSGNINNLIAKNKRKQIESDWLLSLQELAAPLVINQQAMQGIDLSNTAQVPAKKQASPLLPQG